MELDKRNMNEKRTTKVGRNFRSTLRHRRVLTFTMGSRTRNKSFLQLFNRQRHLQCGTLTNLRRTNNNSFAIMINKRRNRRTNRRLNARNKMFLTWEVR